MTPTPDPADLTERVAEEEQNARLDRYHAMVDRKFRGDLSPEEEAEMERLGLEIDAYYDPFYEQNWARIMERLGRKDAQ